MPIFTWSYWLTLQARELMPVAKLALLVGFGALTALGVLAKFVAARKSGDMFWSEGGKRVGSMGLWMGLLGLMLVWFTNELAYFFGARFWYLIWLVVFLIWTGKLIKFLLVDVQEKKVEYEAKARIDKWLPQHKK